MTRLVCIGDCHFGVRGGRNPDRYAAFDQIVAYGLALEALGGWLLAGDVFDAKSSIDDRNAVAWRLQQMANAAPVVLVAGNHDAPGDLAIFGRLAARCPIIVADEAPDLLRVELATGAHLTAFLLPYQHRGGLVAAGTAHADLGVELRARVAPVFERMAGDLRDAAAAGDLTLLLGHMAIVDALSSTGQPTIGAEAALDADLLACLPDIPKLFGHIHRQQDVHGATYLGSIARQDFGEAEAKVFGVLDYASPASWRLQIVPIDTPRQMRVVGRLTREAFTIREIDGETADGADASVWRGADIKVAYAYRKSEIGALDLAKIHAEFAEARSLVLDPQPELDHEVRAPEIAAAATLEQKVEAFCALNQIAVTDHVRACLAALQGNDSASLLAQVRAFAAAAGADEPAAAEVAVA